MPASEVGSARLSRSPHYEVTNVAIRSWRDPKAACRLGQRVVALGEDGGLVRADGSLLDEAAAIADEHGSSVCDAA